MTNASYTYHQWTLDKWSSNNRVLDRKISQKVNHGQLGPEHLSSETNEP